MGNVIAPALPVPATVLRRVADVTAELLAVVEALEKLLREADRLRTTVEVVAPAADDEADEWFEESGLQDLVYAWGAIHSMAAAFDADNQPRPYHRAVVLEMVEMARERIGERTARLTTA
jgi:hypothetical protein